MQKPSNHISVMPKDKPPTISHEKFNTKTNLNYNFTRMTSIYTI